MTPAPAPVTHREVAFRAETGGSFAPTWGQRYIRAEIQRIGPADDWNRQLRAYLPADEQGPVTVARALDAIRTLTERHASLRTRFRLDPAGGIEEQQVGAAGRVTVEIITADDAQQCEDEVSARLNASVAEHFDLEWDWPARFVLGVHSPDSTSSTQKTHSTHSTHSTQSAQSHAAHIIGIVTPHVCLDGAGAVAVVEDLRRIVAGHQPPPIGLDPLTAAAEECGPAARRRSEQAVEAMREAITAAAHNPLRTQRRTDSTAQFQSAHLSTEAFQSAHDYLGRRLGLFASGAITLVATAAALRRALGDEATTFKVECANRWTPKTKSYVGHRAQPVYIAAPGNPTDPPEAIRTVDQAIRAAARHCPHDPDAVQALIDEHTADPSIYFNDLRSLAADLGPSHPRLHSALPDAFLHPAPDPTPIELHNPRPIGTGSHRIKLSVSLTSYEDRLYLTLEADDAYLGLDELPALLRDIEQTVVTLARTEYQQPVN